jgi:hypothetical protein
MYFIILYFPPRFFFLKTIILVVRDSIVRGMNNHEKMTKRVKDEEGNRKVKHEMLTLAMTMKRKTK